MKDTLRMNRRHSFHGRKARARLSSVVALGGSVAMTCAASAALAATYEVGPGKQYASLKDVASKLAPGDVVEVQGGTTYAGGLVLGASGTAAAKITIRGIAVNGARPVLSGGTNTVEFRGDHYVLEGFDITQGSSRCVFHHADDITVRDTVIHDCPGQGLLGADADSGSLTLSYVEVYNCGNGDKQHQVYMATDETAHPKSVFRMEHCFVHDGRGGNNIKSRAERNEIYYNWIEGAFYRELELIGPDGQDDGIAREDSDVVGNVLRRTKGSNIARLGGDGTGDTGGRYRFVNNTILVTEGSSAVFQLFDRIESLELHNNVFYGGKSIYTDSDASWVSGKAVIAGSNNWVQSGTSAIPTGWTGTITGSDPGFANLAGFDLRPTASSPMVDHGAQSPASPSGFAFVSPLGTPKEVPPARKREASGTGAARPFVGTIDIGAYEYGVGTTPPPDDTTPPPAGSGGGSGTAPDAGSGTDTPTTPPTGGTGGASGGTGGASGGTGGASGGSPSPTTSPPVVTPPSSTTGKPSTPPPASSSGGSASPRARDDSGAEVSCDVGLAGRRGAPLAWLFSALALGGLASQVRRRAMAVVSKRRRP
jgi:hypothetical protein